VWCKDSVSHKKKFLSSLLKAPLEQLAAQCAIHWENSESLTQSLQTNMCRLPHCQLLYAITGEGRQISANVLRNGVDNSWRGQELGARPYMQGALPFKGMILSAAYLSQRSMQPCITALQAIQHDGQLLGFIAADFHIKDLPNMGATAMQHSQHLRHAAAAGPPRRQSGVDQNIDYLIYVLSSLMQDHGVFHCMLHFGSACASLWTVDKPMEFLVHGYEELLQPALFQHYPKRSYDCHTRMDTDRVPLVFAQLKALRNGDDNVYLRSASVNIINDRIGLTFSSDGSHYLSADEFLNHDLNYWLSQEYLPAKTATNSTPN